MGLFSQETCNISETGRDRTKVTIDDNSKSHMRFRLVPKSTILDDLEGPLCTVFQTSASFGAHHKNLNEGRLCCQRQQCSAVTLDSGNIRFMRIFAVVLKIYVNFPHFVPAPRY